MSKAKAMMLTLGAVGVGAAVVLAAGQSKAAAPGTKPAPKPTPKPTPKPGAKPAPKPAPKPEEQAKPPTPAPAEPQRTGNQSLPEIKVIPPIPAPGAGPVVTVPSGVPAVPEVQIVPGNPTHLAGELALHLITLQLALGGPKQAKAKYNKQLTTEFQKAAGLTADGVPGPATFIGMARRLTAGTIPLVMFWPKNADRKTVEAYRKAIRAVADDAPEPIHTALYTAADKETGQGGINGPQAPAVKTPVPPVKPPTDNMPGLGRSPADRA